MKNNRLTLKMLKAELDNIKKSNSLKVSPLKGGLTENNIPPSPTHTGRSYNKLYQQSSMFYLWVISGILAYSRKLPFINKFINLLSFWYGRTTIWKILVKIRKIFIIFNALLGVLLVFKTTGFSTDNILAGFSAIGYTYIEILTNFTKRLFRWFVELFDHKIVPNVPGEGGYFSRPSTPKNKSIFIPYTEVTGLDLSNLTESDRFSLRTLYKDQSTPTTSWYKDSSTWLWILGIVSILGVSYFTYKFITDPLFITNIWPSNGPNSPSTHSVGDGSSTVSPTSNHNITPNTSNGIITSFLTLTNKLNPINWFTNNTSINSIRENFIARQNNLNTFDNRYYPFTDVNPYDSWLTKMRISWLGETTYELNNRLREKALAMRELDVFKVNSPTSVVSSINNSPALRALSGFNTPSWPTHSVGNTPKLGNVGLGLKYTSNTGLMESIEASSSFNKLSSLPPTPTHLPTSLPEMNLDHLKSVNPSWADHVVDSKKSITKDDFTYAKALSKNITTKTPGIEISKNKFDILNIE